MDNTRLKTKRELLEELAQETYLKIIGILDGSSMSDLFNAQYDFTEALEKCKNNHLETLVFRQVIMTHDDKSIIRNEVAKALTEAVNDLGFPCRDNQSKK